MKDTIKSDNINIVCWGTYDLGKPRVRILLRGIKDSGINIIECHKDIWRNIEDKTQIKGLFKKIKISFSILLSYPLLLWKYIFLSKHDLVLVPYFGLFDIFFIAPILKIKGIPLVWDFFVPTYDTIVNDRKLLSKKNLFSYLLYQIEKMALKISDMIIVDTNTHGQYISDLYQIPKHKFHCVFVGAEEIFFPTSLKGKSPFNKDCYNVFFYGQFIPLQGIEVIISAAELLSKEEASNICFTIAGSGQTSSFIDNIISSKNLQNINRIKWIEYHQLPNWIQHCDICLGIFGNSQKAKSVIPNKVFQSIASNTKTITTLTPAIKELFQYKQINNLYTLKNSTPLELAEMIKTLYKMRNNDEETNLKKIGINFQDSGKQFKKMITSFFEAK